MLTAHRKQPGRRYGPPPKGGPSGEAAPMTTVRRMVAYQTCNGGRWLTLRQWRRMVSMYPTRTRDWWPDDARPCRRARQVLDAEDRRMWADLPRELP